MILVVGGLNGFIGSNTTEALVDLGQDCVVTRHENTEIPGFLQKHIERRRVLVESADSTSTRSEEHTSELQSQSNLVCRLLLEKKKKHRTQYVSYHLRYL